MNKTILLIESEKSSLETVKKIKENCRRRGIQASVVRGLRVAEANEINNFLGFDAIVFNSDSYKKQDVDPLVRRLVSAGFDNPVVGYSGDVDVLFDLLCVEDQEDLLID